jgi:carbon-monoxide dehydrogenase small subunit
VTIVELTVNGRRVRAEVESRLSLADFLRRHANARSVHLGCEHGVCGACTVLIDGQTARSCIALAVSLEGAEVCTLEGLETDPLVRQLRDSFHRKHGLQCGYCTPGMLVTARDMLTRKPNPSELEVREALAGNLCRCTGYSGIVSAILDAAQKLRAADHPTPETNR